MGKTSDVFKKIRDTLDQPGLDLGRQEYTDELYKKDLHDTDNHDGVITHLQPDILECKVKRALNWSLLYRGK